MILKNYLPTISDTVLSALSQMNTFSTVVSQASNIPSSKCCNFLLANRQLFVSYAANYLVFKIDYFIYRILYF
jgi:hypothetical protein